MKDINKTIQKKVKHYLKINGVKDEKIIDELTSSSLNEYELALNNGMTNKGAMQKVFDSLDDSLTTSELKREKKIPYLYSLIITSIIFIEAFIFMIIGLVDPNIWVESQNYCLILFFTSFGILIYTFFTCKRRNSLDILISLILFFSCLSIFIQCILDFFRMDTGDHYYSISYVFPGILNLNWHYRLTNIIYFTETYFDPTLIVSFITLVICIIFNIIGKRIDFEKGEKVVKRRLKLHIIMKGILNKKQINEYVLSSYNDYTLRINEGKNKDEAINSTFNALDKTIKSKDNKEHPFCYSLIISSIIFGETLFYGVVGSLIDDSRDFFRVAYYILFVLSILILIFTTITYKNRNKFDYVIAIVHFISVFLIFMRLNLGIFYHTSSNYSKIHYYFPGFFVEITDIGRHLDPICDFTFVISLIFLIISIILNVVDIKKRNEKVEDRL